MHRIERNPRTRSLVPGAATCVALVVAMSALGVVPAGAGDQQPLTLIKTGTLDVGPDGVVSVGDLINYTFQVDNSDPQCDVTALLVSDPLISPISCPSGNPIPSLAAMGSEMCTGAYAITQADIDNGSVFNTATAAGRLCNEVTVEATDDEVVPVPLAAMELTKSGVFDPGEDDVTGVGDLIDYELMVTNTGNLPLTNVTLSDPSLASVVCLSGNPIPSLAAGASETCTGSYAITQADIDAGSKENTASATADVGIVVTNQNAAVQQVFAQAMVAVAIPQQPSILLTKTGVANLGPNGVADVGDLIDYTFQVDNTGNVTLINLSVTDPLIAPIACPSGNPIPSLAPGASETCTGSYALTAADIANGSVPNTATVGGLDPMQQPISTMDDDMVMLPQPMPTLGLAGVMALALALAAVGALALRRRRLG